MGQTRVQGTIFMRCRAAWRALGQTSTSRLARSGDGTAAGGRSQQPGRQVGLHWVGTGAGMGMGMGQCTT